MTDRWLRRWSDENGELAAVIRKDETLFIRTTTPAFEPRAGERHFQRVSLAEAQTYEYDPLCDSEDNQQARIEHDPFFA